MRSDGLMPSPNRENKWVSCKWSKLGLQITATASAPVASVERNSSKLMFIKTYLESTKTNSVMILTRMSSGMYHITIVLQICSNKIAEWPNLSEYILFHVSLFALLFFRIWGVSFVIPHSLEHHSKSQIGPPDKLAEVHLSLFFFQSSLCSICVNCIIDCFSKYVLRLCHYLEF